MISSVWGVVYDESQLGFRCAVHYHWPIAQPPAKQSLERRSEQQLSTGCGELINALFGNFSDHVLAIDALGLEGNLVARLNFGK